MATRRKRPARKKSRTAEIAELDKELPLLSRRALKRLLEDETVEPRDMAKVIELALKMFGDLETKGEQTGDGGDITVVFSKHGVGDG